MITEKEKIISDENYEISKKIYNLFRKYKNYNKENIDSKAKVNNQITEFNYEELFNNRKKDKDSFQNANELSIIEIKKENWFIKFIKRLFKRQ